MPHHVPLRAGDPRRVGRYRLTGRLAGLPSDDPLFIGATPDGAAVAIALLGGDWARGGAARDRFAAEAAVAKRVAPFCAARVLDAGLDGDVAYLVSEYIPGQSLLESVAETGVRRGPELEALAIGMATGLAAVHQAGLVHGSFGPQYLILPAEGPPRVVEYGITPPYGSATPSADMLAWAQTVVFAATGHPPAGHGDLEFLPGRTREPVQQCLQLDSLERPAARAVLQFLLGDGSPAAGLLAAGSRRAAGSALAQPASASAAMGTARDRDAPAVPRHSAGGAEPSEQDPAQRRGTRNRALRASRRRSAAWAIVGAAAVVVVLLALLIVHLVQGDHATGHGNLAANTGRPTATTSPAASSSAGPTTPAAFGGTWSGPVTEASATFTVKITLTASQSSGAIVYTGTDFTCSGVLSLISATQTTVTMSQGIVAGRSTCSNGTVTVSLSSANSISFNFQSQPATTSTQATGTLTRS